MHLIVQDQPETVEFMVITNKRLTVYDFCNGTIFLHYVSNNNNNKLKQKMIIEWGQIYSEA